MQRHIKAGLPVFIILAMVLTEMATDIYAPSLPALQLAMNCSGALAQMTIGAYLLGLALAGLIAGPLSDLCGRRLFVLGGVSVFGLASLLCAFSHDIATLIGLRALQGLGGGTVATVGMATLTDVYSGRRRAQMISLAVMTLAFSPGIAPILGSILIDFFSWQASFLVIACSALSLCLVMTGVLRGIPASRRDDWSWGHVGQAYFNLLSQRRFLGYSVVHALILCGLWIEYAGLPFIFIEQFSVSASAYGFYCALGVSFMILGTIANHRWVMRYTLTRLIFAGFLVAAAGHALLLLMVLGAVTNPWLLQLALGVKSFGCALVFSNAMNRALHALPGQGGVGTAVIGAFEMALSALCIAAIATFFPNSFAVINLATLVLTCVSFGIFVMLHRQKVLIKLNIVTREVCDDSSGGTPTDNVDQQQLAAKTHGASSVSELP